MCNDCVVGNLYLMPGNMIIWEIFNKFLYNQIFKIGCDKDGRPIFRPDGAAVLSILKEFTTYKLEENYNKAMILFRIKYNG